MQKKDVILVPLKAFYFLAFIIVLAQTFTGCVDNKNYYPSGETNTPNSFNFATTVKIQLNVKYDTPKDYQVLFEVYSENPMVTNQDGSISKRANINPLIVRMTDKNGNYNSEEIITADHGSEVYIYTSYIGVPMLYKTTINNSTINANINWDTMEGAITATRSADGLYNQTPNGYYALGSWDINGRPIYLNNEGELSLSSNILNTINKIIPEGENCPDKYRQSADFLVQDPKGRDAEVKVRFIGGTSSASSTFGYYCYKAGDSNNKIKEAKKYIVFPNTKTGIGIKGGECVQLHYIDENGVDRGTAFPNNTKIGWFIINNSFSKGAIKASDTFYSTIKLNSDKRTHTAAFRINDFIVLAFEDWSDNDYNDVQFNVWSNPIEAIISPEVPEVKPEEPSDDLSVAYKMSYKGILTFEDNWPSKGDYDLNDVVIRYHSVLSFNTKNEVLSTEDTFTALTSGALYKNGFGYQMNIDKDDVTCKILSESSWDKQGLDQDIQQATVSVFPNALEATGGNTKQTVFKIRNTFKKPINHNTFTPAPYNPFIFIYENMNFNRKEVHLVNYKPTEKADMNLFRKLNDLSTPNKGVFYVSESNYPFAIHLSDAENFSSIENEPIDKTYPNFIKWVESKGTTHKDWYK